MDTTPRSAEWIIQQSAEWAAMRHLVRAILRAPTSRRWTVQGFGMLRAYLDSDKRFRLNVWDPSLAVPNVSLIHDHPWSFDSWVINGDFDNVRYAEDNQFGDPFHVMTLKCGEGGGPAGTSGTAYLRARPIEHYRTGDKYHQEASEIHASLYHMGSVTLNDRTVNSGDGEHARVFWACKGRGEEWVDARPREATPDEVAQVVGYALAKWED